MKYVAAVSSIVAFAASLSACDAGTPAGATPAASASASAPLSASSASEAPAAVDAGPDVDAGDAGIDSDAGDAGDAGADASVEPTCPDDMVRPGRFYCLDRFEGHLVTLGPDGTVTPHPYYEVPETGVTYWARNAKDVFPQAYISRTTAQAACKASGKRLCKREEWMRGCKGNKGWTFPYGNRKKANKCNSGKPHLLQEMFGRDPRKWGYDEAFNSPKLAKEPGYLAESGFFPECQSTEGAFDMVGNLHEWVSDPVGEDIQEILAKDKVERNTQPWREGNGIFMGGFFSTTDQHGPGCLFTTIAHEPKYHDYSTGFRCCKDLPRPPKEKKDKKKKP
ncbi:MAG: SUMF1/EgtB/PvdO family nonheme iron enzyme [Polyangiaceae bacterium]|nr:SUMF1/EgtB/PvdO family nonheme iron enzyme [Polyangiaceae bacterium]